MGLALLLFAFPILELVSSSMAVEKKKGLDEKEEEEKAARRLRG